MEQFIRSLQSTAGYFIRRTYSVMFSLQHRSIFAIANINDQPAILISNEKYSKVYFPKNLQYHFSSSNTRAVLAYKDDKLWIYEERSYCGQTICQAGFDNPPDLAWQKFII